MQIKKIPEMRPLKIDKAAHVSHIDKAITELRSLAPTTGGKASEAVQYVGTIIENTICLLCAPANALDKQTRIVWFDDDKNWVSVMTAVHRSFFSGLHTVTESALIQICAERSLEVKVSRKETVDRLIMELKDRASPEQLEDIISLAPKSPAFADYLEAVLKASSLSKERRKIWRHFFLILGIVRNKASHADSRLGERDIKALLDSKFKAAVVNDDLQLNTLMYMPVCVDVISFFKELGHRDNKD